MVNAEILSLSLINYDTSCKLYDYTGGVKYPWMLKITSPERLTICLNFYCLFRYMIWYWAMMQLE